MDNSADLEKRVELLERRLAEVMSKFVALSESADRAFSVMEKQARAAEEFRDLTKALLAQKEAGKVSARRH